MKRKFKILAVLAMLALIFTITVCTVSASDDSSEPVLSLDNVILNVSYTSDSVAKEGLTYQTYSDPISKQSGIELLPDFGAGYKLYDNPETDIIDGIRINDKEVSSLRIPIDSENPVLVYNIAIRTVYANGVAGTLAQMLDGTYDYTQLMSNPVLILQIVYWACLAITGIVGLVTISKSKGKRVKSADEIAASVLEAASRIDGSTENFQERVLDTITEVVRKEILPLAEASVSSGKDVVKAIIASNCKSKEAPLALLEILEHSADTDISQIIEAARKAVIENLEFQNIKRSVDSEYLHSLASRETLTEVSEDAGTESGESSEKSEVVTSTVKKSVF